MKKARSFKTHKAFVDDVLISSPKLKVVGKYSGWDNHVLVEDKDGIQYLVTPNQLKKGVTPGMNTTTDKRKLFQLNLNKKRNDIIVIGEYKGHHEMILVEDLNGFQYITSPFNLLTCRNLNESMTDESKNRYFKERAGLVHGDKYCYDLVEYKNSQSKVTITCKKHGKFKQTPGNHLMSHNCPKCGTLIRMEKNLDKWIGFGRTRWVEVCENNNSDSSVYVIECFNESERFIKIGITSKTINQRFFKSNIPYEFNLLFLHTNSPAYIYDKEKELHREFKKYRYKPKNEFGGHTECFNILVLNEIQKLDIFKIAV